MNAALDMQKPRKIRVAVIFGGRSAEREVSQSTGAQVIANLNRERYTIIPIEIPQKGNQWIDKILRAHPHVAFIALHGPYGEDGTVQGMLEMLGIPYTCSGVLASALAMDKYRLSEFLREQGIKIPKGILVHNFVNLQFRNLQRQVGFPCVVKPNRLGSSVGITVNIRTKPDLQRALRLAFSYDDEVLVEEYIRGREITAAVLGNAAPRALPLIEIVPRIGNFYNYESKYTDGGSDHIIPAPLPKSITRKIQSIAIKIHQLIGASGITRSDFILRGEAPYFLELNTIPGMTKTSLLPQAAQIDGISFPKLLDRLIELALSE